MHYEPTVNEKEAQKIIQTWKTSSACSQGMYMVTLERGEARA